MPNVYGFYNCNFLTFSFFEREERCGGDAMPMLASYDGDDDSNRVLCAESEAKTVMSLRCGGPDTPYLAQQSPLPEFVFS